MSLLAVRVGAGVLALLALITLRGKRWAYLAFVVLGLLYFPAQTHFHVHVPKCEQILPTIQVLVLSLQNYAYIALFAGFYWLSWVQFQRADARVVWALLATLLVAALVEIAEGMTGGGRGQVHCRVRDLAPDVAGALGAALLLAVWARLRRKPAYVRLVRRHPAAAPPPAAPTSVLSFHLAVSFRPRPSHRLLGVYRGCTYLRPPPRTFHRARALLRQRRTPLRRMRSRRRRRALHVTRSRSDFRRSWHVSGKCCNACG